MRPLSILALILLAGCQVQPVAKPRHPVNTPAAAPIVSGQIGKDETVVQSADRIDRVVERDAPQVADPVKRQTDTIRAAVAANPAADVKALAAQFEEAIRLLREQLSAADARAEKLAATVESLRNSEMKAQARDLRLGALGPVDFEDDTENQVQTP